LSPASPQQIAAEPDMPSRSHPGDLSPGRSGDSLALLIPDRPAATAAAGAGSPSLVPNSSPWVQREGNRIWWARRDRRRPVAVSGAASRWRLGYTFAAGSPPCAVVALLLCLA